MADTIRILGQEAGDDYATTAAAIDDIPSNVVTHGGDNWVIRVRADANYGPMTFPVVTTDATHKVIFEAFPGDEVDGTGTGAGFESATDNGNNAIVGWGSTAAESTHVEFRNLKVVALSTGDAALFFYANTNKVFSGCFFKSVHSIGVRGSNGQTFQASFTNCIIAECGSRGGSWGNASAESALTMDRVTIANCGGTGLGDRAFGGPAFIDSVRNVLAYGNTPDFGAKLDSSNCDYLASSDTTATAEANTTGFNSRTTADFVDYAGGNYNLAAGSSLRGAGEGGADIGATIGPVVAGGAPTLTLPSASLITASSIVPNVTLTF